MFKIDKTKNIILNCKNSKFFLNLKNSYLSEAIKKSDMTPPHAMKISKVFIEDGYFVKEKSTQKKNKLIFITTEKGEKLRNNLLRMEL